jgi:hypothetical protein
MTDRLTIWTIYCRPSDLPDFAFVARPHVVEGGCAPYALQQFETGATLGEVRAKLPAGLTRLDRHPDDDPVIVETWL